MLHGPSYCRILSWGATLCRSVGAVRRLEGACFIHLRGTSSAGPQKMKGQGYFLMSGNHSPKDIASHSTRPDPPKANILYKVSQEERTKLRESVPYVKLYR